jgi:hypothetical protein
MTIDVVFTMLLMLPEMLPVPMPFSTSASLKMTAVVFVQALGHFSGKRHAFSI